jgi:colicin import membrane protein
MVGAIRENSWPVVASVALHGLIAVAVVLATNLPVNRPLPASEPLAIDAVVVDSRVYHAAQQAQAERAAEAAARAAAEQQAAQAKIDAAAQAAADEAAAQAQADQRNEARADAARAAQDRRDLEAQQAALEAKQAAQAKAAAEAKRVDEEKQAAEAKRAADAAEARRVAEERAKREREAELKRQLADEEHQSAVASGPLRDRYIASLRNRIQHAWIKPPSATAGVDCQVEVTQVPGGEVTAARVTQCNGDSAVRQSIENAVYRASPLPDPPDPALFERNLVLRFRPNE